MAILNLGNNNSAFSGSFSGSFQGDGSALTGISGGGGNGTLIASGSVTASTDPATGFVVKASGSTLLDVQGSLGSMFSVSDSFDGNLFEVNNISGISLLNVSSSGDVDIPKGVLTVSGSVSASKFLGDGSDLTGITISGVSLGLSTIVGDGATSGGSYSNIFGKSASSTGGQNVVIGAFANASYQGISIGHSTRAGSNTVAIGNNAGDDASPGDYNILLGYYAGQATTGDYNIIIGSGSQGSALDNQLKIGHGSGDVLIQGDFDSGSITFNVSGSDAFQVIGSEGTLFEVDDSLTGTIFTANDASGLPILQADSTGEVYLGKAPQSLYTTRQISSTVSTHTESIYQIDTSSLFTSAVFDYTCVSQSNATAGQIRAVWIPGTDLISFTDNAVSDIGTTVDVRLSVEITQSKASFLSKTDSAGWQIKTIIRSI